METFILDIHGCKLKLIPENLGNQNLKKKSINIEYELALSFVG